MGKTGNNQEACKRVDTTEDKVDGHGDINRPIE